MPTVYEIVTERILALLEKGVAPWRKSWASAQTPRNLNSGRPYRGLNVFLLEPQGYSSPWWLTYRQAKERGATVRQGEKASPVIFWKKLDADKAEPDPVTGKTRAPFVLRYYSVFNSEQCDGLNLATPEAEPRVVDPIEAAEALLRGLPENAPPVIHGGTRACYFPALDKIHVPERASFSSPEHFYSTLFHELGHSTGHASRLNRPEVMKTSFGTHSYSREELVAEMTAAFLTAEAGISQPVIENQAAYLAHWIEALKSDSRAVVLAAGAAQKAADWLLRRSVTDVADSPVTTEAEPVEGEAVAA
jgi:antirestriction protein ArdC